jgi:SAM-dependent methyltransferase
MANNCPVCGFTGKFSFKSRHVAVWKCQNPECGHLFAHEPPSGQGVHEHAEGVAPLFAARNVRLVRRLIRDGVLSVAGRVLDIGAGLGHIVEEIRRQAPGIEIDCVEAAPESVASLRRNSFRVVENFESMSPTLLGQFDTILLVEVIEHVEDPVELLRTCRSLLRDGGTLFLTTPGGELRNGSHRTAAYAVPEHIQFFTSASLRNAGRQAGFSNIRFREMRAYHAGSPVPAIKWLKDSARILRNQMQGKHHFIMELR